MGRRLLQALGLSTAFFFEKYYGIMNPSNSFFLHTDRQTRSIGWASLLDVLLGTVFFYVLTEALRRTRYWPQAKLVLGAGMLWTFFLLRPVLLMPVFFKVEDFLAEHLRMPVLHRMFGMAGRLIMLPLLLLIFWLLSRYAARIYRGLMTAGSIGLMAMGIFGVLSFYYFARAIAYVPPTPQTAEWRQRPAGDGAPPRVVWIIFDELSERQLYDHRAGGLELPNFDRLRGESTVYTDTRPVGYWTEYVIPSLMQGEVYEKYRILRNVKYEFLRASDHKWVPLDPEKSLYALAQRKGLNVGIAGWYNNYCGLYERYVQSCFWTIGEGGSGPMLNANTVGQNMIAAMKSSFYTGENPHALQARIDDDQHLLDHGVGLMKNENLDFIVVHIPVPHPPQIYDRRTGKMTTREGMSYADGLALADIVLGKFLDTLQADSRWPQTTIVVNGDHSWRVGLWKPDAGWSAEDDRMAVDGFDDRPAMIIHAADQTTGDEVTAPVSLMKVHDAIAAALQGGK
jgi:hypothetical protein